MKKKGFTLVELLAVLIIISVLAVITVVTVGSILDDSRDKLSDRQRRNLEEAAKTYYLKEGMNADETCVDIDELISKGYLERSVVTDPKDSEEMKGSVKITYSSNQYTYVYQEYSCIACTINKTVESKFSVGDVVTCNISGKELDKFYIIEEALPTATSIKALTELNIHTTQYRQKPSEEAGTTVFSTTNYWVSTVSSYTADVYNDSNDIIKTIVNGYVEYLNTRLRHATGSLLTYSQAVNLGCDPSKTNCSDNHNVNLGASANPAPKWVYSTPYWIGSAGDEKRLWVVTSEGGFGYGSGNFALDEMYGVRPVITISTKDIKNKSE